MPKTKTRKPRSLGGYQPSGDPVTKLPKVPTGPAPGSARPLVVLEAELDDLAADIEILTAWLEHPTFAAMRGSVLAGINRRRDRRIQLLTTPIPAPAAR